MTYIHRECGCKYTATSVLAICAEHARQLRQAEYERERRLGEYERMIRQMQQLGKDG